jgi:hypothetical protein
MEPIPPCNLEPLYTTLDEIRSEHSRLLDADAQDEAPGPAFWLAAERFATRVAQSGIYFDEPHEVKACQGYLSYWERELSRASAEKRFSSDVSIPDLHPFDEAALRALQPRYGNPFEHFAEAVEALPKNDAGVPSSAELSRLIERTAVAAGLRFEFDLVKEITGQVAGDSYAPTLTEFCLYHLFEDPQTRIGNKLRRPPDERSFSCLQYLVDQTDRIHAAQGPSEQRAMLDALSGYGAVYDPGVKSDAMISRLKIDAANGAASPTFQDAAGRAFPLGPFLVSSRVLFEHGADYSIVHPALFRRWPELLAAIRVGKDRAERSQRARLRLRRYGAVCGALALTGLSLSLALQALGEEHRTRANALAAQAYRNLWEFEACRAGKKPPRAGTQCDELLERARSGALAAVATAPTSRAMAAMNETIGAMLAADARSWKKAGMRGTNPQAWRADAPSVGPCRSDAAGEICFTDARRQSVALPDVSRTDLPFATDVSEERVALAWPAFDATTRKTSEQVQLKVFAVGDDHGVRPVGGIPGNRCQKRSVSHVRLSTDGRMASLDCAGATAEEGQPLWDVIALDPTRPPAIPPDRLESMRKDDYILSVYFAHPAENGYATLKDDGEVEVFGRTEEDPVVYRSNFLRLTGRPQYLALHPTAEHGFAAIGNAVNLDYPVVVIHDEQSRESTYVAPPGLGTPQRLEYSPGGKCVEVVAVDTKENMFAYHIVLDAEVLMTVAKRMGGATPRYDARALCGFPGAV